MAWSMVLWILGIAAMVWVIYDVLTSQRNMSAGEKVLWIVLAVLLSIITAIIYYFLKKR